MTGYLGVQGDWIIRGPCHRVGGYAQHNACRTAENITTRVGQGLALLHSDASSQVLRVLPDQRLQIQHHALSTVTDQQHDGIREREKKKSSEEQHSQNGHLLRAFWDCTYVLVSYWRIRK